MKYRKKPVEIEAHRWDGDWEALNAWLDSLGFQDGDDPAMWLDDNDHTLLWIATLEGNMRTPLGWVVIIGVQREVYSCKPDIFEQTYEPVADTDEPKESIRECTVCGEIRQAYDHPVKWETKHRHEPKGEADA